MLPPGLLESGTPASELVVPGTALPGAAPGVGCAGSEGMLEGGVDGTCDGAEYIPEEPELPISEEPLVSAGSLAKRPSQAPRRSTAAAAARTILEVFLMVFM